MPIVAIFICYLQYPYKILKISRNFIGIIFNYEIFVLKDNIVNDAMVFFHEVGHCLSQRFTGKKALYLNEIQKSCE